MNNRIKKVRQILSDKNLDALIVSKPENRHYLSGFTGSAGMLVLNPDRNQLITDFRYLEQAASQAADYEIVRLENNPYETIKTILSREERPLQVGFESDYVTWEAYNKLLSYLPFCQLVPLSLDRLRMIKDSRELMLIQKAVDIADQAFTHILGLIKPGISEYEIAAALEYQMRKLGSEKTAFDTIVASGERGALPHGMATGKTIQSGEMVTMDFGAVFQGYHSDITRTVAVGKANDRQRKIYDIVLTAQQAGIAAVQTGKTGKEVDAVARNVIQAAGYGEYFGHGLGHSLGLYIHEEPRLSPSNTDTCLQENMLVTVEPGIYLPGWGGVRIEDVVVVTADGAKVLTASSKQFIEIDG
ncbi:aminopeptidase p and proline dipeptidase signature [Lucifera butyrica]|uniref:Aminopeptidase p and proline dipeptidase signature n=1 Tax=Lucifera butyrica TaxID=1351585 RepID=A0A498R4G5_9FIRM|nr:Xaa-Pro peptidase family protein [Lucifera butyrica]VBB06015.1 aminopeptidase p and proline dipeptidase signature [Lucifera butyrica]